MAVEVLALSLPSQFVLFPLFLSLFISNNFSRYSSASALHPDSCLNSLRLLSFASLNVYQIGNNLHRLSSGAPRVSARRAYKSRFPELAIGMSYDPRHLATPKYARGGRRSQTGRRPRLLACYTFKNREIDFCFQCLGRKSTTNSYSIHSEDLWVSPSEN